MRIGGEITCTRCGRTICPSMNCICAGVPGDVLYLEERIKEHEREINGHKSSITDLKNKIKELKKILKKIDTKKQNVIDNEPEEKGLFIL